MKLTIEKQKADALSDLSSWVYNGKLDLLKEAIEKGLISIDAEITRLNLSSPILNDACNFGQLEIVKFLLEQGANIYLLDNEKGNALYWAMIYMLLNKEDPTKVEIGFEIVEALLDHEFKIRKENPQKYQKQEFLYNILDKNQELPIASLNRTKYVDRAIDVINKYRIRRNNALSINLAMNFLAKTGRNLMLQIFLDNCSPEEFYAQEQFGQNLLHKAVIGFMQNSNESNRYAKNNYIDSFMHIFSKAKSLEQNDLKLSPLVLAKDKENKNPLELPNPKFINIIDPLKQAIKKVEKGEVSLYLLQKLQEIGTRAESSKEYHAEKLKTLHETDIYGDNTMHFICHFVEGRIQAGDAKWIKVGLEMLREVLNYEALIYVNHKDLPRKDPTINAVNNEGKTPIELISDEKIREQIEEIKKLPEVNILDTLLHLPKLAADSKNQKNIQNIFVDHLYISEYNYNINVKIDYLEVLEIVLAQYQKNPNKNITSHEIFKRLEEVLKTITDASKKDNAETVIMDICNKALKEQNKNSPLYAACESFKKNYHLAQGLNRRKNDGEYTRLVTQNLQNQTSYCMIQ